MSRLSWGRRRVRCRCGWSGCCRRTRIWRRVSRLGVALQVVLLSSKLTSFSHPSRLAKRFDTVLDAIYLPQADFERGRTSIDCKVTVRIFSADQQLFKRSSSTTFRVAPSDSLTQLKLVPTPSDHTLTLSASLLRHAESLTLQYKISDRDTSFSTSFPLLTPSDTFIFTSSTRTPFEGEELQPAGGRAEIALHWTGSTVRAPLKGEEWVVRATEALERLGLEGEVRKLWIPEVGRMRATRKVVKVPRIGPSKQGYHLTVCHVREGRGWELRRGFAQTRLLYAQGETHRDRFDDSDEDNGRTLRELMGDRGRVRVPPVPFVAS